MIIPHMKLLAGLLLALFANVLLATDLRVSTTGGNASSPILYGLMFEDINHSGDGGIHAQLLRNNGFQGDSPSLVAYAPVGGVSLSIDTNNPLSAAIPRTLKISVPPGSSGDVGFSNEGYWGIPVNPEIYTSSFYIKGDYIGRVTISLVGSSSGTIYASAAIDVKSNSQGFTQYETSFSSRPAPDGNNLWKLTFDGSQVAGGAIYVSLMTLYPQTFNNRKNGLKPSLAEPVDDLRGSFLRFPGGNNIEGQHPSSRWKWNETIGPLKDRPGREGTWNYANTDALGLLEYLYWCEDMNLVPLLVVYAGLSLGKGPGDIITGDALKPYVEDVLNEIEYIRGPTSSKYGALRAEHGHPEPFPLLHIEIGNEDHLWGGGPSYPERLMAFYNAIHERYPEINLIASTADYLPAEKPQGLWLTFHTYSNPSQLVDMFNKFDNVDRNFPWSVSEFACSFLESTSDQNIPEPTMRCTVAEAVFMIGMERNSDIVKTEAYAPVLRHLSGTQWTPDMIEFNNNPDGVVLSTSYYAHQIFSIFRGHTILKVETDRPFGPVYWVASKSNTGYIVKLANYSGDEQSITIIFDDDLDGNSGVLHVVSGLPDSRNVYGDIQVTPSQEDVDNDGGKFEVVLPGWSVGVLAIGL
ncbi:hypothetical protein FQN51_002333 [Onygenales sp. PD_10]|nr:hypothetical protein FQN51_002333 [Onygenales sp. PD_10]